MSTRNVTIQLDEELIREAKALAAEQGMSLSAMLAQEVREKLAARKRYRQAMRVAFASMTEAASSGRQVPEWDREELHDRP